jgi:hypothetical protein
MKGTDMIRKLAAATLIALTLGSGVAYADIPKGTPPGTPPCKDESAAGPCYWDAGGMGNGYGDSFWVAADQKVHYTTPERCQFDVYKKWVTVEAGAPNDKAGDPVIIFVKNTGRVAKIHLHWDWDGGSQYLMSNPLHLAHKNKTKNIAVFVNSKRCTST